MNSNDDTSNKAHSRRIEREALQYLALCLAAVIGGTLFGVVALLAHNYMTFGRVAALFVLALFASAAFVNAVWGQDGD